MSGYVTIAARLGGQVLLDPRSAPDADELGQKLPELFDVHVMFFADRGTETAQALQRAFSIDAATVKCMLEQAPVVVKRGATPEVAAALLDVLGPLGAQVVLLPSAVADPQVAAPVLLAPLREPQPTPRSEPQPEPVVSSWGALDLPQRARPLPGIEMASSAAEFAGVEFDLGARSEAVESIQPLFDPEERRQALEEKQEEGISLPPSVPPISTLVSPRPPGPPHFSARPSATPRISLPPAVPAEAARGSLAPNRSVPPRPSRPSLGLGSVPPLPRLSGAPPLPPELDGLSLPPLPRYGGGADAREPIAEPPQPIATGYSRRGEGLGEPGAVRRRPEIRSAQAPAETGGRARALLAVLAGGALLYFGVYFDNSILMGNANVVSVVAHGLALYGLGAGLAGLKR